MLIVNVASGQQPKETKRVLIILAGQMYVPGYELAEKAIRAALDKNTDFQFEYFIEYMDRYRFNEVPFQKKLLSLYRTKYINKKIDLIFVFGVHALSLVAAHGNEMFPETPVVFNGVLETHIKSLKLDQRFTGCFIEIDYLGLLNTALNNHPDTRHIAIISGAAKVDRAVEKQARKAYSPYANKYDFIYLGHLPMRDLLDRLAKLPKHTVVIYFLMLKDVKGEAFKPWKVAGFLSEAANAPVYGLADTYLGKGIVGGALISYEAQGRKAGEIGLRILNGENPADIPISAEGTVLNMFDWRQLKRWGINESDLPEGSIVRYKEWSFWDLYRWYIIGGIFLLLFQGFIIFGLVVQRRKGKQIEERLRKAEHKYRTVAEFTSDWEYWEAPHGRLLYVSPSCEYITGYRPSDFVDRPELIESMILPEDLALWNAHSHGAKTGPTRSDCQFRIRAKDGTTRWIEHVCRPVYDEQGNYAGVRASNRDITRLRLAEQEAHENQEALARLNRTVTLEQLAGSIAHELNQPLTGILSNAQAGEMLLKRGDGKRTEIEEILTDIIADGKRSGDILRNLRALFSKQKAESKLLGVNAIVEETLRILNSEFVIQGVNIHQDLSDTLSDVMGNRIQLQQVLINLINNAMQAMQHLARTDRSISIVTARGNESEVQVHVEDTGPGIGQAQLKGIFEPLTTLKPDGLGMGLSISRSIVQAHGGRIWAENIPAGGARIIFTLPAAEKKS